MNFYSPSDIETFCARIWPDTKLFIQPYAYAVTFAALAQNGIQVQQINIQANADFVLLEMAFRAQIGAAQTESSLTAPFVRLLITDTGSNQVFTNSSMDLEAWMRNGQRSFPQVYPRIVEGRSNLTLQATNYAPVAETYTTIDVQLIGVHVYAYDGMAPSTRR